MRHTGMFAMILAMISCGNDVVQPPPPGYEYCHSDPETFHQLPLSSQPAPPACILQAGPCPHLGGDKIHNECADREPPNVVWNGMIGGMRGIDGAGCDISLDDRKLDALSWDSKKKHRTLWEVKTLDWSHFYKYGDDDIKACALNRVVSEFVGDCVRVITCNMAITNEEDKLYYIMGLADLGLETAVNDYLKNSDEITPKLPQGFTGNWRTYCWTRNVQSCRR